MDYFGFKFDLQLFAVNYKNPATAESGARHAIVLDATEYYAIKTDAAYNDLTTKMSSASAVYGNPVSITNTTNGVYFLGADGKLYEKASGTEAATHNTSLEGLLRNEEVDAEKFLQGEVTITNGAVTAVAMRGGDNGWYGETVEIVKGVDYTIPYNAGQMIYSIGASQQVEGAAILEFPVKNAATLSFTVSNDGVIKFKNNNADFVRLLSGDLKVDLTGNTYPANFIFPNGNDDAKGDVNRGWSYASTGGRWAAVSAPSVKALLMDKQYSTSITFTGLATNATANVTVNNRPYTVSNGIKFVRDYTDDGNAAGDDPVCATSVVAAIEGTDSADTLVIGSLPVIAGHTTDADVAVSGDISLGLGNDKVTFDPTTHAINIGGAVLLGDGDNTVVVEAGNVVSIAKGITGGSGVDTYILEENDSTAITINNFANKDKLLFGTDETNVPAALPTIPDGKTYAVTAKNGSTDDLLTIYAPYTDLASAPAFDYQAWVTAAAGRSVIFTADGTETSAQYVTLTRNSATTMAVDVKAAALGKVLAVNLGEKNVLAAISLASADMLRNEAGEKKNTVTFMIGGRSVQLEAATATVDYTAPTTTPSATPAAFVLSAGAVITDATGSLTVNAVDYELGTANMQITGVVAATTDEIVLTEAEGKSNTAITIGGKNYNLTAEGATLRVTTPAGSLKINEGSLTLTIPAATGDPAPEASQAITVKDGTVYTLTRASVKNPPARDLTVAANGIVSKMDSGDTFRIVATTPVVETADYTVSGAVLVKEVSGVFTVFSTGAAITAASTFDARPTDSLGNLLPATLTVGDATAEGEKFESYVSTAIGETTHLWLVGAGDNVNDVRFYGTESVATTTAQGVADAYAYAMYKVTKTAAGKFEISAGLTKGTATTANLKALSAATITFDAGLNTELVNFVTNDTAFTVSADDRTKLEIVQTAEGNADKIYGAVALELTGTGPQTLTLETVGASATLDYVDGGTTATTIDGAVYHVLTDTTGKKITVGKGDTEDYALVTADTKVMINGANYAVSAGTEPAVFAVSGATASLESGTVSLTSDGTGTYPSTNDYASITLPMEKNGTNVTIKAQDYTTVTDGVSKKDNKTTIEVVAENGVATVIKGFGDTVGETITIEGYDYRVATEGGVTKIQRKLAGASEDTYDDMTETPSGYSTSIALETLTDDLNWGATASVYALGGTDKDELTLSETVFAGSDPKIFNLQKDGVTVAVLRKTGANNFILERGAGTDGVTISIQGLAGATVITKGFGSTDEVTADVPASAAVSFTLNGTKYDVPNTAVAKSVAVTGDATENDSKLVAGSVTLTLEATDVPENNSVTVADGSVITITGGSAPATITVSADGVVSGLATSDAFTITNAEGITTAYTVATANAITATNGYYGEYTITAPEKVTITTATGKSNVVEDEDATTNPLSPAVSGGKELPVTLSEGEYVVVKVKKNGSEITGYTTDTLTSAPTTVKTRAEAVDGEIIGYFFTKTDPAGKTQVTYTGDTIGMPVELVATTIDTTANLDVEADAGDLEVLRFTDVAAGQAVTMNGKTFTGTVDNEKAYRLAKNVESPPTIYNTIKIDADADKKNFVLTSISTEHGLTTYKIADASSSTPAATDSFFTVTQTGSAGAFTYTVTYHTPDHPANPLDPDYHIELTDASWAGLVIDATNVAAGSSNGSTKIVIEPAAGVGEPAWADQYTVTGVKDGVAVEDAQGRTKETGSAYIAGTTWECTHATITGYPNEGGTAIRLADYLTGDNAVVYFVVETTDVVNGVATIALTKVTAQPTSGSYLTFTKSGTKITADYVNPGNKVPLSGLSTYYPTGALQLQVDAGGYEYGEVTEIDITDNASSAKNVDYNLTNVLGSVVVTGKGTNDSVDYDDMYTFDISLNLATVIGGGNATKTEYFYLKNDLVDLPNGVKAYQVNTVSNDADNPSNTGRFAVHYDKDTKQATITYEKNGSETDLTKLIVDGSVINVDAGNLGTDKLSQVIIKKTAADNAGSPANFNVENVDNGVTNIGTFVTTSGDKASDLSTTSWYEYTYAADKMVLGDLQPGETKYYVVAVAAGKDASASEAANHVLKGKTTYAVAEGVAIEPAETVNYIVAKNVDGTITLSYHTSTTVADIIDLKEVDGGKVTVDASGLADDTEVANKFIATDSTYISYDVKGLPYSVINVPPSPATMYRNSFVMNDAKKTISLANYDPEKSTVYYEVTGEDDGQNRGKYKVSIGAQKTERYDLAGLPSTATENQINEALKRKNYFTVTTSASGAVSITYTQAAEDAPMVIDLSGAGDVIVNANGSAPNADDKITAITIEKGGDVNYQFTNVRGATTIKNNDEGGSTYKVENYLTTYVIDGKLELSATGTGIVYYDVTRTETETHVVTYTIGAGSTTHSEPNFFAVNYNNVDQGKIFVSYENVGTTDYNMRDSGKKVEIDVAGLPKGVSVIDISERPYDEVSPSVLEPDVYYELTNVPATVAVSPDNEGDIVTKALDYAFAEKSDDVNKSVNIALGASVTKEILAVDEKNAAGVKIGEKYYFVATTYVPAAGEKKSGSVAITKTTTDGVDTYEVVYDAADGHDVVKLSGGQIALDASAIGDGAIIVKGETDEGGNYAITNAPGGTTFEGFATDGSDTVKYSTTFAWDDALTPTANGVNGTYYAAMADNIVLKSGGDAVVPATKTTYLAVTIKAQTGTTEGKEGSVKYAWMTPNEKTGVMEMTETTFAGRVTVTAPNTTDDFTNDWNFDANGFGDLNVDIVGVESGATIINLASNATATMTPTAAAQTLKVNGKLYKASTALLPDGKTKNAIKVSGEGVVSGVVTIDKTYHGSQSTGLTAASKKSGATTAETVWVETAAGATANVVTFGANGIESISGLDIGEVIRVVENGEICTYTTTDGFKITRTNMATNVKTVLALTKAGDTFFGSSVTYVTDSGSPAQQYTTGFSWLTTGVQYVEIGKNATAGVTVDTETTVALKTAEAGMYLLALEVTGTDVHTLKITPKVVNGFGEIVDATGTAAYEGQVDLDAGMPNTLPVDLNVTNKTYKLHVTGAKAGSSFIGVGKDKAGVLLYDDLITTEALATGESVTVNEGTYTNAGASDVALSFAQAGGGTAWGLNAAANTKLLVTAASGTLTAVTSGNLEQTVSYKAGTVSDGAVVTFNSGAADAVTSIEGLTGGESVTVTLGGVTTTYTADEAGTTITRTVTWKDGTINTRTITGVTAGENILSTANKTKWDDAPNTVTSTLDWTKNSIGYFKLTNNVVEVAAGETKIASTETDTYVAAQVTVNPDTGVKTLTLTGKAVTGGIVGGNTPLAAGDMVNVTLADGTLVSYNKAENATLAAAAVKISGAAADSTFTNMTVDKDQVTTAALATNDAILFNENSVTGKLNVVVSAAADNVLTIAGNATDMDPGAGINHAPRIVTGSVQVGGKYAGTDATVKTNLPPSLALDTIAYGSDSVLSVVYTDGGEGKAKDGVVATFTKGNPTSITGLTNGESVLVTYADGATYTYTATNEAGTEIMCEYDNGKTGPDKVTWTRYCMSMTSGGNILDGNYSEPNTTSIFNWTATKAEGATTATGYFTISATGVSQVAAQTAPGLTLDAGTNYVAVNATTAKGFITVDGVETETDIITLGSVSEVTVADDGSITEVAADKATVKKVDITFPAATIAAGKGTTVKVNAPADRGVINAVTLYNVGTGSVIGGNLTAADKIVTSTLAAAVYKADGITVQTPAEFVTVNDKKYIAGAASALTVYGDGKVENGTLALNTRSDKGLSEVVTYYVDGDMNRISETISYATSEKTISGAVVNIVSGEAKHLTNLRAGETVTISKTSIDKNGVAHLVKTTYEASLNSAGTLVYTKTKEEDGIKTVSTGNSSVEDVDMFTIGWTEKSKTAKGKFEWEDTTGYFLLGENKFDGTVDVTTQDTAVSINKSKAGNVYLKVTSSGNSAKGYTITTMKLVRVMPNGDIVETGADAKKVKVNVTLPSAGVTFADRSDANIVLNATGATAGKFYDGLEIGDSIAWSSVAKGDKCYVNGTPYVSGADGNAVTLKLTDDDGDTVPETKVTQGTLVVKNDLNSSVENGALVDIVAAGEDGVVVTYGADGHVSSVTDLENTEQVKITETKVETIWEKADDPDTVVTEEVAKKANEEAEAKGEADVYVKRVTTTTIGKTYSAVANIKDTKKVDVTVAVATTVTQTLNGAPVVPPKDVAAANHTETWTKEAVATTEDVINLSGFKTTADPFSWEADAVNPNIGYFAIEDNATTIAKQEKATEVSTSATYLKVETTAASTEAASVAAQIVALVYDTTLNAWVETAFNGTITIPATGSLDVSAITDRGAGEYAFAVTGAGTGKIFTGFTADDTIATADTFYADNTITISDGVNPANDKVLTAAATGQLVVSGEGKAISGSFKIEKTNGIVLPKDATGASYSVMYTNKDSESTKAATIVVKDGVIQEIRDVSADETVTVTITKDGKTTTETYAATAGSGADTTLITKTVTDGVTTTTSTTTLTASQKYSDIYGAAYTQTGSVTSSTFNWANTLDAYFEVHDGEKENTYKATVVAGATVDINPTTDTGNKYLKVTRTAAKAATATTEAENQTITAISLVELQSDGTFRDVTSNLGTGSVVTITLPTDTPITYAKSASALYGVQISVPTAGSKITGLKATDAIGQTGSPAAYVPGKAFGIKTGTTIGATGMTIATETAAMNVVVNGMRFVASDAAGLTIQANSTSDTYLTKGTVTLNTDTTVETNSQSVMIQKLVKAVPPATEDLTGDKITVTASDTDKNASVTVDIYGSFDATAIYTGSTPNAANLTIQATNTSGTVIEKYAVDAYGNITATNAAGSTRYALLAAPTGKITLDGTIDSVFDTAALVQDAADWSKVTLLDNSRTTVYTNKSGYRFLTATYTKAATEGDKDTYAIASDVMGGYDGEIDTTALTGDKVTINGTNLTGAKIKLTDAKGTTAVVQLTNGGTMNLEAGAVSGVQALTLLSGELVNASGLAAGATTGVTLGTMVYDQETGTALYRYAEKVTVNGVTYKNAYDAVVTAVKEGDNYVSQLYNGTVTAATGDDALALTGGSTVTATGKVVVTAAAGAVSSISDFQKGEKVAIRTGTTTVTYEAISDSNIKVITQPDGGTATEKTASYAGGTFNPTTLVTYDALTTAAGDIDWTSTTAKTTYRLVPDSGTVDLSAASKQTSFSYEDAGKHLFATTVQAGTNTLTVTVNEIIVGSDGSVTTLDHVPADDKKFTLTTASLAKGTTVTLNGASTGSATPYTYTTAADGTVSLEGDGDIVGGKFTIATTLSTSVDGLVTLANAVGSGTANTVTVANGKVTAISGLDVGESVTIGNVEYKAQTRVVEGETIYEIVKTVTKGTEKTEFTATVTKETMADEFSLTGGLAFTSAAASVDTEEAGKGQGQFQWATADTRGVGYFLVQKASATKTPASITVADQASKTVFTTKETGNTYMVASLEKNGGLDELTLTAQRATVTTDEVTFSDTMYSGTVKISVAKDYTGNLVYDAPSDRPYNVEFTGVTKGAVLTNLGAGLNGLVDKVTTASLAENEDVTVNGITYTAGAKGALTFQDGKLYAGTVKLSAATADSLVTTGNAKKGTPSMTVSGANFVGDDTNEVIVKVANGEITSITGLVNAGEKITVSTATQEYVYTVLDSAGTMIKRESDGVSVYTTIKTGGNVYVTKDTSWKPGVTFGPGGTSNPANTTATADSKFWSGKTVRYYKIGASANLTNGTVAELVASATEGVQGEYYIAVSATDSKITSVTLMQVSATGELKKASTTLEKSFNGRINLEAETALVYTAAATRNWHFNITGVTNGAKITNLNDGDFVTTGEVSYQGTVTVDSLKYVSGDKTSTETMEIRGGKPDAVTSSGVFAMSNGVKTLTTMVVNPANEPITTYTVKYGGGKDEIAVTVENGEVTAITGLGMTATSGTVTVERVDGDGKKSKTFTLKNGVITQTYMDSSGKEIVTTATNTAGFDLLNGEYNDDAKMKDVAYNFTWNEAGTMGYFKVANLAKPVTVKTAKGTIKTTDVASNYLAVELENATATAATVKDISLKFMNPADNTGMDVRDGLVYTGALTLTVPKGIALTFDRSILKESMENAQIAITGVAADSEIKNLKKGETVTTGALAENASVKVNSSLLQAGAKNTTLKVSSIDEANVKVESGKVKLTADNQNGYAEEVAVAKDKNTNCIVGVTTGTVVVSATASGFTVESLGAGDVFTVTEMDGTYASYQVSEGTLIRVKNNVTSIYKMNASSIAKDTASVTSAVLNKETNWQTSTVYGSDAHKAATARAKIDLKAADTNLTKYEKAGTIMPDYYFVTDDVVDQKTITTKNGVIATTMLNTTDKQVWELKIGSVTTDDQNGDGFKDRKYEASDSMGQNILAATGWEVTGGSGDDTITGATSGKDTLRGGSGDDSMVGGAAADTFIHTGGADIIKSYASGKDKVQFVNGFDKVTLSKTDVILGSDVSDMLVLLNAAANQANGVEIKNGNSEDDTDAATYYFGKSTAAANFTKLTDGARYYGQTGLNNKITVSTDKTKATKTALGDSQTVDLTETARYHNIVEVNATGSANKVKLVANNAAATDKTTLRGGSYMTTMVGGIGSDTMFGGSGNDFFQFNEYSGTDVITKYDGKKDSLYVAGGLGYWEISSDNKHLYLKSSKEDKESIKLENVVGGTAVNVAEDSLGNNVTSYFFGKAKAANTYTGTDNTDPTKGATKHADVFFVNQLAKSTTVKFFGVDDEIKLNVSGNYTTVKEIMDMMTSSSGANSVYSIEGQKLTISDKFYSMNTSNTQVSTSGGVLTIKRTK